MTSHLNSGVSQSDYDTGRTILENLADDVSALIDVLDEARATGDEVDDLSDLCVLLVHPTHSGYDETRDGSTQFLLDTFEDGTLAIVAPRDAIAAALVDAGHPQVDDELADGCADPGEVTVVLLHHECVAYSVFSKDETSPQNANKTVN